MDEDVLGSRKPVVDGIHGEMRRAAFGQVFPILVARTDLRIENAGADQEDETAPEHQPRPHQREMRNAVATTACRAEGQVGFIPQRLFPLHTAEEQKG